MLIILKSEPDFDGSHTTYKYINLNAVFFLFYVVFLKLKPAGMNVHFNLLVKSDQK